MRASHVSFRAIGFYVVTLSLMVLLFGLSIRLGTYTLSFEEIWAAFQPDDKNYFTLMEYRLPRAVLAILLGGALAISGVLVQSVVRNPLASPDILGINNAAGLIAVSVLMFLPNLAFYWMPIFAFLGGVLSFVILWIVCGFNFRPIKMAIIGVALSALWAAISHYLMLTNPVEINGYVMAHRKPVGAQLVLFECGIAMVSSITALAIYFLSRSRYPWFR